MRVKAGEEYWVRGAVIATLPVADPQYAEVPLALDMARILAKSEPDVFRTRRSQTVGSRIVTTMRLETATAARATRVLGAAIDAVTALRHKKRPGLADPGPNSLRD